MVFFHSVSVCFQLFLMEPPHFKKMQATLCDTVSSLSLFTQLSSHSRVGRDKYHNNQSAHFTMTNKQNSTIIATKSRPWQAPTVGIHLAFSDAFKRFGLHAP